VRSESGSVCLFCLARDRFDLALAIDAGFALGKSERGHPM